MNAIPLPFAPLEGALWLSAGALAVAGAGWIWCARRLARQQRRWKEMWDGVSATNLEGLVTELVRDRKRLADELSAVQARLEEHEARLRTTKRHLGLVRFDAFTDVAGQQSFSLALLDDDGNGALLTSLVGRTDGRVFGKPLVRLQSERNLSAEEQQAIREAREGGSRTILS
jgi:hypothetical protein